MRILIQGAGIGGLTLARALRRVPAVDEVVVLERNRAHTPAGAGITLGPNALAVLDDLGIGAALRARGAVLDRLEVRDAADRLLSAMALDEGAFAETGPSQVLGIHRGALHEVLADGIEVRLGVTATAVAEHEAGVRVSTDAGLVEHVDLVVGADGIGSALRAMVVPDPPARTYAGYTCWRLVVRDPLGPAQGFPEGLDRGIEIWGRGQRAGLLPMGPPEDPHIYCFLVEDAPAGTPEQGPTDRGDLRARFAGLPAAVGAVIDALPPDAPLLHHDIESLAGVCWGTGRVVLLGDAAHALTPNMGQGAAMAIEDAWVLADLLRQGVGPDGLVAALAAARTARVRRVVRDSERIGRVAQWSNPLAAWLRDRAAALTPDAVTGRGALQIFQGGPVAPA